MTMTEVVSMAICRGCPVIQSNATVQMLNVDHQSWLTLPTPPSPRFTVHPSFPFTVLTFFTYPCSAGKCVGYSSIGER
jgi:hypothetical protein